MTIPFPLPPEWVRDAICAQIDPELWFPETGHTTGPAKALCRRCPVIDECLAYALDQCPRDVRGVWGGTSEREREKLRRKQRQPVSA